MKHRQWRVFRTRRFIVRIATLLFAEMGLVAHLASAQSNQLAHDVFLLKVTKAEHQATLMTWPEEYRDSRIVRSFDIALGKESGDKQAIGDNRTPEGIYFTQAHIHGRLLPKKYGALAIPINYPNPMDKVSQKTGFGIWLHGVERDGRVAEKSVTEGCVAFHNQDIDLLQHWLPAYQALVVIGEKDEDINRPEDLVDVQANVHGWLKAWQSRDVEAYGNFYAENFAHEKGRTRASYKMYKKLVFDSYTDMRVSMSNIRIVTHPKYAVAVMQQEFQGDKRFHVSGRKVLYWQRDTSGKWKISREIFDEKPFLPHAYDHERLASISAHLSSKNQL